MVYARPGILLVARASGANLAFGITLQSMPVEPAEPLSLYTGRQHPRCGRPSLACSLILIRLPTGTAFYAICHQMGFCISLDTFWI